MGATLADARPAVRISAVLGAVLAVELLAGAGWSFNAGLGADTIDSYPPRSHRAPGHG